MHICNAISSHEFFFFDNPSRLSFDFNLIKFLVLIPLFDYNSGNNNNH